MAINPLMFLIVEHFAYTFCLKGKFHHEKHERHKNKKFILKIFRVFRVFRG
jgi:hypothetical protein